MGGLLPIILSSRKIWLPMPSRLQKLFSTSKRFRHDQR